MVSFYNDYSSSDDRPSCQSVPVPNRHRRYYDYVSQWEPLSMNALIEYTKRKEAEGVGEFNQGRPKMWTTEVKVTWDKNLQNETEALIYLWIRILLYSYTLFNRWFFFIDLWYKHVRSLNCIYSVLFLQVLMSERLNLWYFRIFIISVQYFSLWLYMYLHSYVLNSCALTNKISKPFSKFFFSYYVKRMGSYRYKKNLKCGFNLGIFHLRGSNIHLSYLVVSILHCKLHQNNYKIVFFVGYLLES